MFHYHQFSMQPVTKAKIEVIILQSYMQYQSLTEDLLLVKDLSALRSNLKGSPSSRGDFCLVAMLLSMESSKKAHLGCHVYKINWLACS